MRCWLLDRVDVRIQPIVGERHSRTPARRGCRGHGTRQRERADRLGVAAEVDVDHLGVARRARGRPATPGWPSYRTATQRARCPAPVARAASAGRRRTARSRVAGRSSAERVGSDAASVAASSSAAQRGDRRRRARRRRWSSPGAAPSLAALVRGAGVGLGARRRCRRPRRPRRTPPRRRVGRRRRRRPGADAPGRCRPRRRPRRRRRAAATAAPAPARGASVDDGRGASAGRRSSASVGERPGRAGRRRRAGIGSVVPGVGEQAAHLPPRWAGGQVVGSSVIGCTSSRWLGGRGRVGRQASAGGRAGRSWIGRAAAGSGFPGSAWSASPRRARRTPSSAASRARPREQRDFTVPDGAVEHLGRLGDGVALHVDQHQRRPLLGGQGGQRGEHLPAALARATERSAGSSVPAVAVASEPAAGVLLEVVGQRRRRGVPSRPGAGRGRR